MKSNSFVDNLPKVVLCLSVTFKAEDGGTTSDIP